MCRRAYRFAFTLLQLTVIARMLCHASSNLYAFRTSSLTASVPELKTCRSVSSTNINTASSKVIPDNGMHSCVVTLFAHRHLTKNVEIIIHNAGAALLPCTTP